MKKQPDIINDAELGSLKWNDELKMWEGQIKLTSEKPFQLFIFSRNNPERLIETESRIAIQRIKKCEQDCRKHILDHMLEIYNEYWSEGETITEKDLDSRISPDCVTINEDGYAEVNFDDGGLLLGHLINVRFRANGDFQEVGLQG
jgi:hypothetical protein